MKKAVSLFMTALMVSPTILPAYAQKRPAASSLKQQDVILEPTRKQPKSDTTIPDSTSFGTQSAYTDGNGVWLAWQMQAEVGNICFYIYRLDSKGKAELLSPEKMVAGAAVHGREIPAYGNNYNFYDVGGSSDSRYYIEALSLNGSRTRTGQFYPQYVPDLRTISGLTTQELQLRGELSNPVLESSGLNLTKELITEVQENALAPNPTVHRSVITQNGVARIGVKVDGIYRVTRAQLDSAGFDTSTDPTNWQLYVDGNEQAMIVDPSAQYIEFYGKALDRVETDIHRYYLINGAGPGMRMTSRVATRNTSTVLSPGYKQTFVKKERNNFVDDIVNGDAENYWGRGVGSGLSSLNFTLSGIDTTSATSTFQVRFQGYSETVHVAEITLNDQVIGSGGPGPLVTGETPFGVTFTIPTSLLHEGSNTVKFRSIGTLPATTDFSFFDSILIDFNRKYLADQNKLSFYTPNYRRARLEGFSSANVRVFDLTADGNPVLMTNLDFQSNGTSFGADMPPSRGRVYFAVEDSAVMAPESVTANNPELIGNPANGADLIIISHKDFLNEAQTWANYRTAQGFSVKVIEVSECYDEYNYGAVSSNAIQSFLADAYYNWTVRPRYVLLMGDGSWDSRNYEGLGNFNFVPAKFVDTVYTDTASDEALVDFDLDGLAEIPIGRISARTPAQATIAYNKMVQWEALPGANWNQRGAVFAYDFDNGYPFSLMSANLRSQIPEIANATMVFRGEANANTNILNALGTGPYIVNYSGHGTAGSWGGSPTFFNVFSVPSVADSNTSIYTMLTCLNGYFHWLYNPSMGEVLLFTPNKGAVAAWASSGLTTADIQEQMATRFYQKINEGSISRMGDVVRDAKLSLVNRGTDVRLSWVLLGDPMLKVR